LLLAVVEQVGGVPFQVVVEIALPDDHIPQIASGRPGELLDRVVLDLHLALESGSDPLDVIGIRVVPQVGHRLGVVEGRRPDLGTAPAALDNHLLDFQLDRRPVVDQLVLFVHDRRPGRRVPLHRDRARTSRPQI